MRAVVYDKYGPPEVLQLKEVEQPEVKDNEILIKVHATTVASEDCTFRKGRPLIARSATGFFKPKHPIPGTQFAGEISAVGNKSGRYKNGDMVFGVSDKGFGAYAEYICLPGDGAISIKPENIDFEEAAATAGGALTALAFLRNHGNIQEGQKVLVNGASGSVGTAAVQLAKYFGAGVIAVCSTGNIDLVRGLGADKVIDYKKEDFTQYKEEYDMIFDSVGKSSFAKSKSALKKGGIYLTTVVGMPVFISMLTSKAGSKKAKIAFTGLRPAGEKAKDLGFIKELIESGKYRSIVDRKYGLENIVEAHRYVDMGHKKGNVVVTLV